MKKYLFCIFAIIPVLSFFFPGHALPNSQDNIIRAKIGILIKTSKRSYKARTREQLKSGSLLRIYIQTENASFVYVVYDDGVQITLLEPAEKSIRKTLLILPSDTSYYVANQEDKIAGFTVVVSPKKITKIQRFSQNDISKGSWEKLKKELSEQSNIILNQDKSKPFPLAGNVRGQRDSKYTGFIEEIPVYSGNELVIKTYEFKLKK